MVEDLLGREFEWEKVGLDGVLKGEKGKIERKFEVCDEGKGEKWGVGW